MPTDDRRNVANAVPFISDGVPQRAGGRRLQGQPELGGGIERMDRRPALRTVTGTAEDFRLPGDLRRQAGEASFPLVMNGTRHANGAAAHAAWDTPCKQSLTLLIATGTERASATPEMLERMLTVVNAAFAEDRAMIDAQKKIWDVTSPEEQKALIPQAQGAIDV